MKLYERYKIIHVIVSQMQIRILDIEFSENTDFSPKDL